MTTKRLIGPCDCLYYDDRIGCTAPDKISCQDALIMTGEVQAMERRC